jgi:hypothetical protein
MATTYFLARLIGLLLLPVGASMLLRKTLFMKALNDITGNSTSLFMAGIVLLLLGLSLVLTHNLWHAGFLPLVITLIGWILILRGIASMFVPGDGIARMIRWFRVEKFSWLYALLVLAIGAYLTWAGFTDK